MTISHTHQLCGQFSPVVLRTSFLGTAMWGKSLLRLKCMISCNMYVISIRRSTSCPTTADKILFSDSLFHLFVWARSASSSFRTSFTFSKGSSLLLSSSLVTVLVFCDNTILASCEDCFDKNFMKEERNNLN